MLLDGSLWVCVGSPLFLKMRFIIPVNHSSGITPVSKIKLNNLVYKDKNIETVDDICSFNTLSYPAALLFF